MVSDLIVLPALLVTLGIVGMYKGWKRRHVHAQMTDVTPTPVGELSSPGVVEVEGRADPVDEPTRAPVTDREAVLAAWTIAEWDERGDRSTWREVARGIEAPAFTVDDGTGAVRVAALSRRDTAGKWTQTTGVTASDGVRIDDVLVEFDTFPVQTEIAPDEEPPEGIRRLHDDHGLYEDTGSVTNAVDIGKKHGRRRYAEQVVEPGEDVYVLGRVEARDGAAETPLRPGDAVVTEPSDGLLVLSNQSEEDLESEFASDAKTLLVGGAGAAVVGAGLLAYMLFPL